LSKNKKNLYPQLFTQQGHLIIPLYVFIINNNIFFNLYVYDSALVAFLKKIL